MSSYTLEQHVQMENCIIKMSVRWCNRFASYTHFTADVGFSKSTLQHLVAKFETTGLINDQQETPDRPSTLPLSIKVCKRTVRTQFLATFFKTALVR